MGLLAELSRAWSNTVKPSPMHGAWIDAVSSILDGGAGLVPKLTSLLLPNQPAGVVLSAAQVDANGLIEIAQTTASQNVTLSAPTTTTAGRMLVIGNNGTASFTVNAGARILPGLSGIFVWNGAAWSRADAPTGVKVLQQLYTEIPAATVAPFTTGQTILTNPITTTLGNFLRISYSVAAIGNTAATFYKTFLLVDGVNVETALFTLGAGAATFGFTMGGDKRMAITPGAHTVILQAQVAGATLTIDTNTPSGHGTLLVEEVLI